MNSYKSFIFKSYNFDEQQKTLSLNYSFDDQHDFCETFTFGFDYADYDKSTLDRALQSLFFMAGVSYYKAFATDKIEIRQGQLDSQSAQFFSETYQKGLGEFFYINNLDPHTSVPFKENIDTLPSVPQSNSSGLLIGIGGGKDSLVSVEILRNQPKVATWSVGHRSQLEPLIEKIGLPHFWVSRSIDRKIVELNSQGARNGHIPISAILSCVGTVVAILTGYQDVVVSNENSANEPTLHFRGVDINHQYSKSLTYETDYQKYLLHSLGNNSRYYSLLRPFSELRIAEMFSEKTFDTYKETFSSCNRAFTQDSDHMIWCGECAKCAFVFVALTPFIARDELEKLWGKNLLLDPSLITTYKNLLGIDGQKPLDCVGEIKESRAAMKLAQDIYPELNSYEFEIPADYDYKTLSVHRMPDDIFAVLIPNI
ncbi:MAG: UDP-N-acetyl-alpha-D-muramoyl-L-alanyl-L-glutamate epimerase [Patescibacteria group bacterium]|nr:UDP-N-acetyl-alpha-D-muramoyl-L-alanyl-L-glutamate epimerase [Patescibacteria group bacterium]